MRPRAKTAGGAVGLCGLIAALVAWCRRGQGARLSCTASPGLCVLTATSAARRRCGHGARPDCVAPPGPRDLIAASVARPLPCSRARLGRAALQRIRAWDVRQSSGGMGVTQVGVPFAPLPAPVPLAAVLPFPACSTRLHNVVGQRRRKHQGPLACRVCKRCVARWRTLPGKALWRCAGRRGLRAEAGGAG